MNAFAFSPGNLFINGKLLPGLWSRLTAPSVECPVWAQTYAADRWRIRYSHPTGATVSQARSLEIPEAVLTAGSVEIRGNHGVQSNVCFGQNIEADEALNYRRRLRFSAWLYWEHPTISSCEAAFEIGSPVESDLFDQTTETMQRIPLPSLAGKRWNRIEASLNATAFRSTGLRVDLQFPREMLSHPESLIRITDLSLACSAQGQTERPVAIERMLAQRFFQRHDGRSQNAIGRALTCNPHELFFQFTFPEMRCIPACTLSQDNADLCVFSSDGQPQTGFVFDATFGSRGSLVIRATKMRHQLRDGYLAFRGYRGAIVLDAEL